MKKSVVYLLQAVFVLLFVIIINWMFVIKRGDVPKFDQWTRPFVETIADTPIYTIFRWITELGSFHFVLPFTLLMVLFFFILFRDYLPAMTFGLGVLTAHLLNKWIKIFISRERPSISELLNAEGFSFPSGHSMVTIVCYGLIAYLIGKKLRSKRAILTVRIGFGCLVFLIGFSRYILNVHYLTDIISGFLFGFIVLSIFIYLYEKIQKVRKQNMT